MIFSISFSNCGNYFISGSRDKYVKLWKIEENDFKEVNKIKLESPVYSVEYIDEDKVLAGLENGKIHLLSIKDLKLEKIFD